MGQPSRERLRLGRIEFLNVLPIYYPLESGIISHPFSIVSGSPAFLNRLMAEGHLDLSVVSSIEYARHPDRYFLLPDLSISCHGTVKSVLLFSRVPVDQLGSTTIIATNQSHTSVALLKILFSRLYGLDVTVRVGSFAEASAECGLPLAFLAIGDEALRLSTQRVYPFCMDLGEAWHSWTGLPFVFALWVIQREAAERWNGELRAALEILAAAKEWGQTHLDRICAVAAQKGVLSEGELSVYYRCLGFDLNHDERKGLDFFFRLLEETGEIPSVPELEILSPLACVA